MDHTEKRRYPRTRVNLAAEVLQSAPGPVTAVIDLSEGGACLDWSMSDAIAVGAPLRLRFLLAGKQTIEVDGRVVRIGAGHAGVEFLPAQQDVVRQLLAESRSED
jgi:hypothetical protein